VYSGIDEFGWQKYHPVSFGFSCIKEWQELKRSLPPTEVGLSGSISYCYIIAFELGFDLAWLAFEEWSHSYDGQPTPNFGGLFRCDQ
jgi:hypothetical protein